MNQHTALEFFAGIGLARMGIEEAGWKVIFANDVNPRKFEMYREQFPESDHYIVKSVFDLDIDEVPVANLAWASFPCIDLSLAGNRAGLAGNESSTYWGFYSLLLRKRERDLPQFIVIENVPGIISSRGGSDLATIMASLGELGYRSDVLIVDAAHFVPQSRPRVFIVSAKDDLMAPRVELPQASELRPDALVRFARGHRQLPWGDAPVGPMPLHRPSLVEMLEEFPEDADVWWDAAAVTRLLDIMPPQHRSRIEDLSCRNERSVVTVYRRIRPHGYVAEARFDGLAGCLRTARGGSSKQFVVDIQRGVIRVRHMSPREYARLQGAGHYRFSVKPNQAINGFGDAVCVPVVTWLMRYTVEPLAGRLPQVDYQPALLVR